MPNYRLPAVVVSFALITVACGSAGTASPGGSAAPTAPPSQAVEHPTGANDIVLQMEEGGGFVPIEFLAGQAPTFTLYGDGRIVFVPKVEVFPEPGPDGVIHGVPWRTAQLDPAQVDELLESALGPGGLGAARENYGNDMVADAGSTYFRVDAGGVKKEVAIYALGMEGPEVPDQQARKAFLGLAERLRDFDRGGAIGTEAYVPTSYRAVLVEREGDPGAGGPVIEWPWPNLTIADFPSNVNGAGAEQFPHRALAADEAAELNIGDIAGGIQNVVVKGPDSKVYSLILRPLLPHESE
jgi:hypothetical protein